MHLRTHGLACLFLVALACGTPTPDSSSDAGVNNSTSDVSNATTDSSSPATNGEDSGGSDECVAIGERFIEAVRGMPRDCVTATDCTIVTGAQVCDCDLAVSATSDTTSYEAVRAEADAANCANPFGCPNGECPYRRLADPGELVANCSDEGMCEVVQVLTCDDYVAGAHGGLVPPGGCMDDTQCKLRSDLNPCGCPEAISDNFPFLTVQATAELIEINDVRCGYQCMGCNAPTEAVCGTDGQGNDVCQAM